MDKQEIATGNQDLERLQAAYFCLSVIVEMFNKRTL